jgi:hypothetical protein
VLDSQVTVQLSGLTAGTPYELRFAARPTLRLGPTTVGASLTPTNGVTVAGTSLTQNVTEPTEPANDALATAPVLGDQGFSLQHISSSADIDYFQYPIPASGDLLVRFSHGPADYDVVVYGPAGALAGATGTPLEGQVLLDQAAGVASGQQATSQAAADLHIRNDLPVWSFSNNRGIDVEELYIRPSVRTGNITIQVTGYNGAADGLPYMVRVQRVPETQLPNCEQTIPFLGQGVAGTATSSVRPNNAKFNTLFLVDRKAMGNYMGTGAATQVMTSLTSRQTALANLGFPNVVLPVETDGTVQTARNDLNASPCSVSRNNALATAIRNLVIAKKNDANWNLQHVVVVGPNTIIPDFLIDDLSFVANEGAYAGMFADRNTQYLSGLADRRLRTLDPYVDFNPVPFMTSQLNVPDAAIGRVGETPAAVEKALANFVSYQGLLDPQSAIVTGYDFVADGALAVKTAATGLVPGTVDSTLVNDTWTGQNLLDKWLPLNATQTVADVVFLAAHFDHPDLLPASENKKLNPALLTTQQVKQRFDQRAALNGYAQFERDFIFSIGCHSGFSADDVTFAQPTDARALDWPQLFSSLGMIYAGQSGFGLGDKYTVGYSEKAAELLAQRLKTAASVGDAAREAKAAYLGLQGLISVYDQKVAAELTLYGLPMWRLPGAPAPLAPLAMAAASDSATTEAAAAAAADEPPPTFTDPITGLTASLITVDPLFTRVPATGNPARYDVADGDSEIKPWRPILPRLHRQTQSNIHGTLIIERTSQTQTGFEAQFSRPIVDNADDELPVAFQNTVFGGYVTRSTDGNSINIVPAVFSNVGSANPFQGILRLDTHIVLETYSSASNDYVSPVIQGAEGVVSGGTIAFTVQASDPGNGLNGVKRVLVLLSDNTGTHAVELTRVGNLWTGGRTIDGTAASIRFDVQAVDAAGNVGRQYDKNIGFAGAPPQSEEQPPGAEGLTATVTGTGGSRQVKLEGEDGVTIDYSLDGAAFQRYTAPFTVSGDGTHRVDARASDRSELTVFVTIDTVGPGITIVRPADNGAYTFGQTVESIFYCTDAAGVATCNGPATLDTSTPTNGTPRPFTVTATDLAGRTTSKTHNYWVYRFSGFFSPIMNPPAFNSVKSGSVTVIKFSLGGYETLNIFSPGFPLSHRIDCTTAARLGADEVVPPGVSTLTFNTTNQWYHLAWKTDSKWMGTCRELVVRLRDGTDHLARFKFTR